MTDERGGDRAAGGSAEDGGGLGFARELRERRAAADLSLARLAELIHYSRGHISRVERGEKRPSEEFARSCDRVLEADGALLALVGDPDAGTCPYPGLAAFRERDAGWFFGRERAVAELLRILADPSTAGHPACVVGPSGAGKSSLLRAGLMPGVERGALPVRGPGRPTALYLTPTADPADVLRRAGAERPFEDHTLIVVDQFEEAFTLCESPVERADFISALCEWAAAGTAVVLGVRADFYGHCLAHPRLVSALRVRQLPLGPMTTAELRRAITEPAVVAGLRLEPGLVELLLRDLGLTTATDATGTSSAALPLLSHALRATWQQRGADSKLSVAGYELTGGVHGGVAATAERAYATLAPEHQGRARHVLLRLVRVGGAEDHTRRRVPRGELLDDADVSTRAVVEAFTTARLLIVDADHLEISHEALLRAWPRLREWIAADASALRQHEELILAAGSWQRSDEDPTLLYRGTRLAAAQDLAEEGRLGPAETRFLRAGLDTQQQETRRERQRVRRLRRLVAAMATALVLAAVATGFALDQRSIAQRRTTDVLYAQLARASADAREQGYPEASQLLAVEAHRHTGDTASRSALLSAQADFFDGRLRHGRTPAQLVGHALSADGRTLVTHSEQGLVEEWDLARRTRRRALRMPGDPVHGVAVSADADMVVAAGESGTVRLWGHGSTRARWVAELPFAIEYLALSPDRDLIAVAGKNPDIVLLSARTGRRAGVLRGPAGESFAVAFSPDGKLVAACGEDHAARLWDTRSRRLLHTYGGGSKPLYGIAFSRDGGFLATAGGDNTARVWRTHGGRRQVAALTGAGNTLISVAFSPDGTTLAAVGFDLKVRLWHIADRRPLVTLDGHTQGIFAVSYTKDGTGLMSSAMDGSTLLWDLRRGFLPGNRGLQRYSAVFMAQGGLLATTAAAPSDTPGAERPSLVWDVDSHAWAARLSLPGAGAPVRIASDATGRRQAALTGDGRLVVRDTATAQATEVSVPAGSCGLALSGDGRTAAVGTRDGSVQVWRGRALLHTFTPGRERLQVCALDFGTAGTSLAIGGDDGRVRVARIPAAADGPFPDPTVLGTHTDEVRAVALSPDGAILASGGNDYRVRLWDLRPDRSPHRALPTELSDLTGEVHTLDYAPDGGLLAASGGGFGIHLYDTRHGYRLYAVLRGHQAAVGTVVFSPRDETLASVAEDGTARIWDLNASRVSAALCRVALRGGRQDWPRFAPQVRMPSTC
ncbi:helix-turn-helix domain-containing protein [Streptomyces cacaoi]